MAKQYIKKVEVVNTTYFKKLGLNPADMGLSQRRYTDRLITLVKPCSNRSLRSEVQKLILDFVAATNGKHKDEIKSIFRSVMIQIERNWGSIQDPTVEWKFSIDDYAEGAIRDKLRGED